MDTDKMTNAMVVTTGVVLMSAYLAQFVQQLLAPPVAEEAEPYGAMWLFPAGHIMNVEYGAPGGETEPTYFGEAMPGTLDSDAAWRIYRYEYEIIDGDPEVVGIRFAEGNTNFDKVWDDRGEYEYS